MRPWIVNVERLPGDMGYYVLKHGDDELAGIMRINPADAAAAMVTWPGRPIVGGIDGSPFGRVAARGGASGATFKSAETPAPRVGRPA